MSNLSGMRAHLACDIRTNLVHLLQVSLLELTDAMVLHAPIVACITIARCHANVIKL